MIAENTSVIKCALNYIPEPIQHMKLVFSAILLSFARDSGWDQLLYVITQLPTSYLPRIDHLCMAACNVWPLMWGWPWNKMAAAFKVHKRQNWKSALDLLFDEFPKKNLGYFAHAQTVSTTPFFGGEGSEDNRLNQLYMTECLSLLNTVCRFSNKASQTLCLCRWCWTDFLSNHCYSGRLKPVGASWPVRRGVSIYWTDYFAPKNHFNLL